MTLYLTTAARNQLAAAAGPALAALTLTRIQAGSGSGSGGAADAGRVALRTPQDAAAVAELDAPDGTLAVAAEITGTADYDVTEAGLFGRVGAGAELLVAYWSNGGAVLAGVANGGILGLAATLGIQDVTGPAVALSQDVPGPPGLPGDCAQTEAELATCEADLTVCETARDACQATLAIRDVELATCEADLTVCETARDACQATLAIRDVELATCEADLTVCETARDACQATLAIRDVELATCEAARQSAEDSLANLLAGGGEHVVTAAGSTVFSWPWDTAKARLFMQGGGGGGGGGIHNDGVAGAASSVTVNGNITSAAGGRRGRGSVGSGVSFRAVDRVASGNGGDGAQPVTSVNAQPGGAGDVVLAELAGLGVNDEISITVGSGGARGATADGIQAQSGGAGVVLIAPIYG